MDRQHRRRLAFQDADFQQVTVLRPFALEGKQRVPGDDGAFAEPAGGGGALLLVGMVRGEIGAPGLGRYRRRLAPSAE